MGEPTKRSGFTIVELIIVIVVIAILATISIVAYGSIQQRARNAQTMSGVKAYEEALLTYAADHDGAYPALSYGCLGDNYPSNQCWTGPNGTFSPRSDLDAALAPYLSPKPTISTKVLKITSAPDMRLGAVYIYTASEAKIVYYLEGQAQICLNGSAGATEQEGTQCALILPQP